MSMEEGNNKGKVMFFVPNIPGTAWEKAARLVQMAKDVNASILLEMARINTLLGQQAVYMALAEDQLHAQYMKFEETLIERLKTIGLPADEANWIYDKLARPKIPNEPEERS